MKYVKVYDSNSQIVDALSNLHFVYWNSISNMIDDCSGTDERRMGLLSFDASTIWHLYGRPEFPQDYDFSTCQYTEIDKEEFEALRSVLDDEDDSHEDTPQPSPTDDDPVDENTLELVRMSKLNEVKKLCEDVIAHGIDVTLSDGGQHHFSLTEYDQLNLFKLETIARSGEVEVLPYHEDDALCKFYPVGDVISIANAATNYITYHTTYHNSLKSYIKSLNSVSDITNVVYGVDIPEEFQSDVWKELNKIGSEED